MTFPASIRYAGPAWVPDIKNMIDLPERVWPVVDRQDDEWGTGLIVALTGTNDVGLVAVINDFDLNVYSGEGAVDEDEEGPLTPFAAELDAKLPRDVEDEDTDLLMDRLAFEFPDRVTVFVPPVDPADLGASYKEIEE